MQSSYIDYGVSNPVVDQREELPLLPFGNPIGNVSAASRRISLIIRFHFVSFVLFVVIFLSRYNLLTPSSSMESEYAEGACPFGCAYDETLSGSQWASAYLFLTN